MNSIKEIINIIPDSQEQSVEDEDIMLNPAYLRCSSSIITDALQKGFDVLQLENGDIVTTGTKIIVTQYNWDSSKQKMVKKSAKDLKKQEKSRKTA